MLLLLIHSFLAILSSILYLTYFNAVTVRLQEEKRLLKSG